MSEPIVAVDTGGTFTDVVALVDGRLAVLKVPSTPDDPARAVIDGIRRLLPVGEPFALVHGSTVATNTLLERTGARVALVTNRGFEDVIEIGRQDRPQLYAIVGRRPPPLVDRADRHGVAGRLGPGGEEEQPLDDAELDALADRVRGAEAVAVCLLHSYADPAHEERVARALDALGIPVSVSARLLPEYREYERMATTVVNAYIAPRMDRYLGRLAADSGARRVRIMGSGGGAIPVDRARREPVHTVLSGPAGGVMGAIRAAADSGFRDILTFDMGGTSTDVALCPGAPQQTREFSIAGLPVAVPVLDIHTVGAGGGSIAQVDAGGALRVGPASAGADPGPICYGRGGTRVTVTDAHVWLGRLPPHVFLGGQASLDRDAIAGPMAELARSAGTDPNAVAEGVIAVADTAMEGALRVISVERGHDPADFTLLPFGGAAGLHAVGLAERLGIPRLLLPPDPGVLSAFGMLVAPVRKDAARTVLLRGDAATPARVGTVFDALEAEALEAMAAEGLRPDYVRLRRLADVRYAGQSFELRVPAEDWAGAFHRAHAARYGFERRAATLELVTLRVEALGPERPTPRRAHPSAAGAAGGAAARAAGADSGSGTTAIRVRYGGAEIAARAMPRSAIGTGDGGDGSDGSGSDGGDGSDGGEGGGGVVVEGPLVVHEYSATLWLPPGWTARGAAGRALLIERAG